MTMVEGQSKPLWSGWRKVAGLSIIGGIGGYFLGKFAAESVNDGGPLANLVGVEVALLVSLLYIMMGLFVGLGSLSPRVGAALLNVEDADEVREEGPTLRLSAAGCILIGISLASIALGGAGGLLAPTMALLIGGVSLVLATVLSVSIIRKSDELMRAVMQETASASYYLLFAVLGIWSAIAYLGMAPAPRAIDVLTAFWAAPLLATFWTIGRRGMMAPRS